MDDKGDWFGGFIRDRRRDGLPLEEDHIEWLESHPEAAEAMDAEDAARALRPPPVRAERSIAMSATTAPTATPWAPTPLPDLPKPNVYIIPGWANPDKERGNYAETLANEYKGFAAAIDAIKVNGVVSRPQMDQLWADSLVGLRKKLKQNLDSAEVDALLGSDEMEGLVGGVDREKEEVFSGLDGLVMDILSHQLSNSAEAYWARKGKMHLYLDGEPAYLVIEPSLDEGDFAGLIIGRKLFAELERETEIDPSDAAIQPLGHLDERDLQMEIDVGPRRPILKPKLVRISRWVPRAGKHQVGVITHTGVIPPPDYIQILTGTKGAEDVEGTEVEEDVAPAPIRPVVPGPQRADSEFSLVLRQKPSAPSAPAPVSAAVSGLPRVGSEFSLVLRQKRKRAEDDDDGRQ